MGVNLGKGIIPEHNVICNKVCDVRYYRQPRSQGIFHHQMKACSEAVEYFNTQTGRALVNADSVWTRPFAVVESKLCWPNRNDVKKKSEFRLVEISPS